MPTDVLFQLAVPEDEFRLVLKCWLAFCFGWVLSLFTRCQVWHSPELCELIQHANLGVRGKTKIRCIALAEVTQSLEQEVSCCSQGRKQNCEAGSE